MTELGRPPIARVTRWIASIAAVGTTIIVAYYAGSRYGQTRAVAKQEARKAGLSAHFREEVRGLEPGREVPNVPLRLLGAADSTATLRQLSEAGVFALYIEPSCDDCLRAAEAFQEAALPSMDAGAAHAFLIAASDLGLVPFESDLRTRGVHLPLYVDQQQTLRREHGFVVYPLLLIVEPRGVLSHITPAGHDVAEYTALLP